MVSFSKLNASCFFDNKFINITFGINDTTEDLTNYKFDLFRANNDNDEFKQVYGNIQNFECNDYAVVLTNPEINYFYKIKATNVITEKSIFSDVFSPPVVEEDEYAFFLSNIYDTYLDVVINNKEMYLYKKKRTGELCSCYDDVRGSTLSDKCTCCFGTGYKGGYYPPQSIKVNFITAPMTQEDMNLTGSHEAEIPIQVWTKNYPTIQENDLIADTLSGKRYTVVSCQVSRKNGFVIRQTLQLTDIPESNILYKVK